MRYFTLIKKQICFLFNNSVVSEIWRVSPMKPYKLLVSPEFQPMKHVETDETYRN
jgi:hypothetical protein